VLASQTASFAIDETTYNATFYPVSASGAARTVTLPAASGMAGKVVEVKKTDSTTNVVVVDGNGSETIDGALIFVLYVPYQSIRLVCDGSNWHVKGTYPTLLARATAASTAISSTTSETPFDNVSLTIKANSIRDGESIRIRLQGIVTAHNASDTLNVKLKFGSQVIVATGAVNNAANDVVYVDATVTFRVSGGSGKIVAYGVIADGVEGTATSKPFKLAEVTSFDTTADIAVTVTGTWSASSASDSVRLDGFIAERQAA
jgi:hypothetical protein